MLLPLQGILMNIGHDNTFCGKYVIVYIHFLCLLLHQGSNLDSNAKMWRLVADFMNDLGNVRLKTLNSVGVLFIFFSAFLNDTIIIYSCKVRLLSHPISSVLIILENQLTYNLDYKENFSPLFS